VYASVVETLEISTECKALHPAEKGRVVGEHIFKGTVLWAPLAHQNPPGFLDYLSFNYSRPVPEISDTRFPTDYRVSRLNVAIWAQ
jgi:hypothetical protein